MKTTIPMDKAGRMVLPKAIRKALQLRPGDQIEAEWNGREVTLRPPQAAAHGIRRMGRRVVWDAPGASSTVEEIEVALRRGHEERDDRAMGL